MMAAAEVTAWRPAVSLVVEVFHARFTDHAYPMHSHRTWTLLLVDDGVVRYDLDRHEHGALEATVTLLPPHVPHNGNAATPNGFRKRVIYLRPESFGEALIGRSVDKPGIADAALRRQIHLAHRALRLPGEEFEAETRLALVRERLSDHLERREPSAPRTDTRLAGRLRELLDARVVAGLSLEEAAAILHSHPAHLVRSFSGAFGMPPHRYLTSLRVDLAREFLLDGLGPARAATAAGFYDQSHLTRHFRRIVGTTPARFADQS